MDDDAASLDLSNNLKPEKYPQQFVQATVPTNTPKNREAMKVPASEIMNIFKY